MPVQASFADGFVFVGRSDLGSLAIYFSQTIGHGETGRFGGDVLGLRIVVTGYADLCGDVQVAGSFG